MNKMSEKSNMRDAANEERVFNKKILDFINTHKYPVEYPQEFIDNTKGLFPNNRDIHAALDSGSAEVGSILYKALQKIQDSVSEWNVIYFEVLRNG